MKGIKNFVLRFAFEFAGALTGGFGGWCYWYFVGCSSGTCLITSHPLNSILYGALVGSVCFGLLKRAKN